MTEGLGNAGLPTKQRLNGLKRNPSLRRQIVNKTPTSPQGDEMGIAIGPAEAGSGGSTHSTGWSP